MSVVLQLALRGAGAVFSEKQPLIIYDQIDIMVQVLVNMTSVGSFIVAGSGADRNLVTGVVATSFPRLKADFYKSGDTAVSHVLNHAHVIGCGKKRKLLRGVELATQFR